MESNVQQITDQTAKIDIASADAQAQGDDGNKDGTLIKGML